MYGFFALNIRHMRLTTLLIPVFCLATAVQAQVPPFEMRYTMPGALEIKGGDMDEDGNYYFPTVTDDNLQVTKLSPEGVHEWTYTYPYFVEMGMYGDCLRVGPNGIVVVGYAMGLGTNSRDGLIIHIDMEGTLIGAKRIDVVSSNALHYLEKTSDGFIATGRADQGTGNQYDMLLAKLDEDGNMLWSRTYGKLEWDWGYRAIELSDGGFAIVGYGDQLGPNHTAGYIVRTDAMGNELWARSITSGVSAEEAYCVAEGTDGSLYVGGRSLGSITGKVSAFLTKLTSTGTHVWTRVLEDGIEVENVKARPDGGVDWLAHPQYFTGGGTGPGYDIAWGSFDANGNMTSSKYYGTPGAGSDNGMAMFRRDDGGISIIGMTNAAEPGRWDALLIVTDAAGNLDCNEMTPAINWQDIPMTVAPVTSDPGSGFTEFPWPLSTLTTAVGSFNPCCLEEAAFTMSPHGDYTWYFTDASTGANSYLWDFGDGTTSTEASPSHTYAGNGQYNVCLTITGNCGSATSCQTISITVGIEEQGQASIATLYPSPAKGQFTVESSQAMIKELTMIDGSGRTVRRISTSNARQVQVTTGDLPSGVYAVRLLMSDNSNAYLRVIIEP